MPDTWEIPEELAKAYPKNLQPVRIQKNRLEHTSPIPEWPGKVVTPMYLDAEDYLEWWELSNKKEKENQKETHWTFEIWPTRYHLIKDWRLEDVPTEVLQKDPSKIPDMRILVWINTILGPVIAYSTSIPNSQGPFSDTTKTNDSRTTA